MAPGFSFRTSCLEIVGLDPLDWMGMDRAKRHGFSTFQKRDDAGDHVEGEIFEIPDAQGIYLIDGLEGNGSFYQRRLDDFIELDSAKEQTAWVYYIMREMDGEPQRRF